MKKKIIVAIPAAPPSANLIWRNGRHGQYLSAEARAFYAIAGMTTRNVKIPADWSCVDVEIVVETPTGRGDVDNRIKPVLDALTRAGVWSDDRVVGRVSCQFAPPGKGRTLVTIRPLKDKYTTLDEAFNGTNKND